MILVGDLKGAPTVLIRFDSSKRISGGGWPTRIDSERNEEERRAPNDRAGYRPAFAGAVGEEILEARQRGKCPSVPFCFASPLAWGGFAEQVSSSQQFLDNTFDKPFLWGGYERVEQFLV